MNERVAAARLHSSGRLIPDGLDEALVRVVVDDFYRKARLRGHVLFSGWKHGTMSMSGSVWRMTSPSPISAAGRPRRMPPLRPRIVST